MDQGDVLADRYEVGAPLGRGGMGQVFRGRDRVLGRDVALKVLSRDLVDDDDSVARILTEARLAAKVRHPNVVQVLDAVVDEGHSPVIVLELVDGPSLADVIRDRAPLPVDEALDLVAGVAAGLAAAHAADLVHRDVSPANVLLDAGTARLTDFGIARSTATSRTLTGTIRGSVAYVAPEQATGTTVGPATDVYALACLAIALLTGRPPYEAEEPLGVVHQHVSAAPPDVRERRPEVGPDVAAALQAAMAKDPRRRIPTAAAVAAALGRPLRHDDTEVVFAPTTGVVPVPGDPGPTSGEPEATTALGPLAAGAAGDDTPNDPRGPTEQWSSEPLDASSVTAASVASSGSVDHDGGDSGPIVVIGPATGPTPTVAPAAGHRDRRVGLPWVVGGMAGAAVAGVVLGVVVAGGEPAVGAAAGTPAPDAVGVTATAVASAGEVAADALLRLRSALAQLQAADDVAPAHGELVDGLVDAALDAVAAGDADAADEHVGAIRDALDEGVADGGVTPEAEVVLLAALLEVDDGLSSLP